MTIEDLPLSNKILNKLKRKNINTIQELLDIRNNKNFLLTPFLEKEICEVLSLKGLKLNEKILTPIDKLDLNSREKNLLYRITREVNKDIFDLTIDDLLGYRGCGKKTANDLFSKISLLKNKESWFSNN